MRKPFMGRVISLSISVALSLSFAFSCASPASGPESKDYLSPTIGTLKYVSGGTFSRDSFSTNISTVSDFRIGVNAVTQEQYYAVTGWYPSYFSVANGPVETVSWYDAVNFCNLLSAREGLTPYYSITDITTETGISDGRGSSYTTITNATVSIIEGEGYRLPTMMEFYWAAMGGIDDTRSAWYIVPADDIRINLTGLQKSYAGAASSNNAGMDEYVWNASNSDGTTHPVKEKAENPLPGPPPVYEMTTGEGECVL